MTFLRMLPVPALILLTACGGATPKPVESAAVAPAPAASASASASPDEGGEAEPAPGQRDPKLAALAKAAVACKFEDEAFDTDCPAYKAWDSEQELFEDGKGDDTILSMLGDPDLKVRMLAAHKEITHTYWEDKGHAETLYALGKAEKNEHVAADLGNYADHINAEEVGLAATLKDVAKHAASPGFRKALAYSLNAYTVTPTVVEADQILIDDPDPEVRETAVEALARGTNTEALCKLMAKQIVRSDVLHAPALYAASSTECAGLTEQVAAELAKRIADPSKVTKAVGYKYAWTTSHLCRSKSPAMKKKGLELAKQLTGARIPDERTRNEALDAVIECDPKGGVAFAGTLLKDKVLGRYAKIKLDYLKEKAAKKK